MLETLTENGYYSSQEDYTQNVHLPPRCLNLYGRRKVSHMFAVPQCHTQENHLVVIDTPTH